MKHYDGPAFYRLHPVPKPKRPVQKKVNKIKQTSVHHAAQPRQRVTSSSAAPLIGGAGTSRPFHPSHIPPSIWNLTQSQPDTATTLSYERLYQELHKKSSADFLVSWDQPEQDYEEFDLTLPVANEPLDKEVDEQSVLVTPVEPETVVSEPEISGAVTAETDTTVTGPIEEAPAEPEPDLEQPVVDLPTEIFLPPVATDDQQETAPDAASVAEVQPTETPNQAIDATATVQLTSDALGDLTPTDMTQAAPNVVESPADAAQSEQASVDEPITDSQMLFTPVDSDTTDVAEQETEQSAFATEETSVAESSTELAHRQSTDLTEQEGPRQLMDVTETDHQVQSAPMLADEPVAETEIESEAEDKQPVITADQGVTPRPKQKERALNRSLTDILDFEQNSQRDLALFKEQKDTSQPNPVDEEANYQFPDLSLLPEPVIVDDPQMDEWVLQEADVLNETLQAFHVDGTVKDWTIGPTVTQFEITLGRGVKVNKVTNLTDDLKLALAAKDIRIEAPIPGKSSIGIEIPNQKSRPVMLREVLQSQSFQTARSPLTVALGVDLFGKPQVTNLKKMPHGLIAGATGSGKSVFINSLLVSLLYKAKPSEVKLLLIDPKAVEMAPYQKIPHLLAPVISDPKSAAEALKWVVKEMDERYERLAASGARNIDSFNEKVAASGEYGLKMPYIVIVIDELADLMMVAASEVQDYIARITAKARAAGIHLLIATQRPSVDVVTGTIKNNIPTRVAFMVASQVDSRTILDSAGAERLLGKGDMLYLGNGASQTIRLQGTFIDEEVDRITDFVRTQGKPHFAFDPDGLKKEALQSENEDELMPEVLDYIVDEQAVSTSKLQRVFSVGYNRAASIIDDLENKRYISGAKGSKPRDVFLTPEGLAKLRGN